MTDIVDAFPYPWALPVAQELHIALTEVFPTVQGALFVAEKAGIQRFQLFTEQPAFFLWHAVLDAGANRQANRQLVTAARDALPPNNPRRPFLDALLAGNEGEIPLDRQPRAADGTPVFLTSSDDITEPEALLFKDDLTMSIGRIPWLIAVLERLRQASPSVCRMLIAFHGGRIRGTGFRISSELLLTNWHVLHHKGVAATSAKAEFGFEDDAQGGGLASTVLDCDLSTIQGDAADDWAVVRTATAMADTVPIVKLSEAIDPKTDDLAFIVQHPGGERKRLAFVRNQVTAFDDRTVHYLSDTQTGSSGAPVFHESGRLMALHHAGGRAHELAGKPPLSKNEGIRIPRIRQKLAELGIAVP